MPASFLELANDAGGRKKQGDLQQRSSVAAARGCVVGRKAAVGDDATAAMGMKVDASKRRMAWTGVAGSRQPVERNGAEAYGRE